ncbi:MAG: hypothetical protein M3N18_04645 [Actinomycetota bacterium]|nr:hypothetical protein [Actinomycetota bacterium]
MKRRLESLEAEAHRATGTNDVGGRPAWFTAEEWAERERGLEALRDEIRAYAKAYFGLAEEEDGPEKGEV